MSDHEQRTPSPTVGDLVRTSRQRSNPSGTTPIRSSGRTFTSSEAPSEPIRVSGSRDQLELDEATAAAVQASETLFREFRNQNLSRDEAIRRFRSTLGEDSPSDGDRPRGRAVDFFVRQLDEEQRRSSQSRVEGERIASTQDLGGSSLRLSDAQPSRTDIESHVARVLGSKHPREHSSLERAISRDSSISGSDDGSRNGVRVGGSGSSKRIKVNREDLPWTRRESSVPSINPKCLENQKLLLTFSYDIPFVVSQIRLSTIAPAGFPSSEWTNICKGQPVNLDVVLSSLHLVHPPKTLR
ncbi:hypothetical protein BJ165DRAFT_1535463 [Panaeolus papilionaceus]|nr:hypothetical protein BJ165DRAFT_1535463 [Panaeolus papilionaceus]